MLYTETVTKETLALLKELMQLPWLDNFRLVGGTGLSLQYGHRISVDIDLFTDKPVDFDNLSWQLFHHFGENLGDAKPSAMGIFAMIRNIKTDFINWGNEFSFDEIITSNIRMASPLDIAAMKLTAITNRKTKKDFFDIAFLLQHFSLKQMIEVFEKSFFYMDVPNTIKELVNFAPADKEADPNMLIPLTWGDVKQKIETVVKEYWESELG
jgi:nucleotidyltransferase AbiEii toxin of type IV toxin-antitoxin system